MKRIYEMPAVYVVKVNTQCLIAATQINPGNEDQPGDVKRSSLGNSRYNVWDDDWSE